MELQTVVKLDKPSFRIDYSTRLMMLGSCFVENVGAKLEYFRFKTDINPCGIVYNPLSVADTLELLLAGKRFSQADLLRNGELPGYTVIGSWDESLPIVINFRPLISSVSD